jgi:hypothetical protein
VRTILQSKFLLESKGKRATRGVGAGAFGFLLHALSRVLSWLYFLFSLTGVGCWRLDFLLHAPPRI